MILWQVAAIIAVVAVSGAMAAVLWDWLCWHFAPEHNNGADDAG